MRHFLVVIVARKLHSTIKITHGTSLRGI